MSCESERINQITIYYGPIQISNVWAHRPKRLKILMDYLTNFGFNVEAEPMLKQDYLIVKLNNVKIFSCRFTLLKFHYDEPEDFILHRIIWSAIEARARFSVKNKQ